MIVLFCISDPNEPTDDDDDGEMTGARGDCLNTVTAEEMVVCVRVSFHMCSVFFVFCLCVG